MYLCYRRRTLQFSYPIDYRDAPSTPAPVALALWLWDIVVPIALLGWPWCFCECVGVVALVRSSLLARLLPAPAPALPSWSFSLLKLEARLSLRLPSTLSASETLLRRRLLVSVEVPFPVFTGATFFDGIGVVTASGFTFTFKLRLLLLLLLLFLNLVVFRLSKPCFLSWIIACTVGLSSTLRKVQQNRTWNRWRYTLVNWKI